MTYKTLPKRKQLSTLLNSKKIYLLFFILVFLIISLSIGFYLEEKGSTDMAEKMVNSCRNKTYKEGCYKEQFNVYSLNNTIADSQKILSEVQTIDKSARFCHIIAHKIANNAVSKNPQNWIGLLDQVDIYACNMGFFHGIIEGHMQTNPDFLVDRDSMLDVCVQVQNSAHPKLRKSYFNDCIHTMAHILLVQEDADVIKSLSICREFGEKQIQFECSYGVFMEEAQRQNLQLHGFKTHSQMGFKPIQFYADQCNQFLGTEQAACWMSKGWVFYQIEKDNPLQMFEDCNKAESEDGFLGCYEKGLGTIIALDKLQDRNRVALLDYCNQGSNEGTYEKCTMNFLKFLISIEPTLYEYSRSYCGIIRENYRNKCKEFVAETINNIEEKKAIANSTSGQHEIELNL